MCGVTCIPTVWATHTHTHTDRVTETDKANEKLVMELLKSHFPEHQFIGEVRICVDCVAGLSGLSLTD